MMKLQLLALSILFLFACGNQQPKDEQLQFMKLAGPIQGTSYHITYATRDAADFKGEIENILHNFDKSLSIYDSTSIISRINRDELDTEVDAMFEKVLQVGKKVHKESHGAFDMTVAPLVNAWGWGFTQREKVDSTMIDSLLQYVGFDKIKLNGKFIEKAQKGIMLDANAIAQGYSVDLVCDFLDNKGIENYMVEIGGELRTKGKNPKGLDWRIGIDKPLTFEENPTRELQEIVSVSNKALATSGNYRKFFVENGVKYSHSINPKTGFPVQHSLLSATIIAAECIDADAYATACMVSGLEVALAMVEANPDLEGYFIYSDEEGNYQIKYTKGFEQYIPKKDESD